MIREGATAKRKLTAVGPSDEEVRALLDRYQCPVQFHAVRTRFLGNIATPVMAASPIETVKGLWGGELPEFDTIDAANELIGALVMGFWNRLTRHQDRGATFRLTRNDIPAPREGLACVKRGKIIHRWWKLVLCSGGYPPRDRLRPGRREQQGGWHFPPAPVE